MNKQICWMYLKAFLKILITSILIVLFYPVLRDGEPAMAITMCCTMGVAALIYIISGILTIKNGAKQAKKYIREYPNGAEVLNAEYDNAEKFGGLKIGEKHIFVNSSNGFYILPLERIQKAYVLHHGENRAKLRPGYYYLYISVIISDLSKIIKVYYISKKEANAALTQLLAKCNLQEKNE
ncbi:MAG: hypothetical protein E7499_07900 [Ruminococcus sp.]|nr:hypothetical protein [Ruminococcus sp.]